MQQVVALTLGSVSVTLVRVPVAGVGSFLCARSLPLKSEIYLRDLCALKNASEVKTVL